jgi:hypothetical protein
VGQIPVGEQILINIFRLNLSLFSKGMGFFVLTLTNFALLQRSEPQAPTEVITDSTNSQTLQVAGEMSSEILQ